MSISLEDFITKKIALSVEGFSNESIKMVIDEIRSEGKLNWITHDAEQSFFACDDRPRYLFIQFSITKDPQLNWINCLSNSNSWIARPITDLWLRPIEKGRPGKRYKVSVYKATHHPQSIFFDQKVEVLPTWLREHDGEEVSYEPHSFDFKLRDSSSNLFFNWYWVEEMEKENDKN